MLDHALTAAVRERLAPPNCRTTRTPWSSMPALAMT